MRAEIVDEHQENLDLLLLLFDVLDGVLDGADFLRLFIGDFDAESFLKRQPSLFSSLPGAYLRWAGQASSADAPWTTERVPILVRRCPTGQAKPPFSSQVEPAIDIEDVTGNVAGLV
jgi:hypothetical protein